MRSKIAPEFCKCEVCPSAEVLLSFHRAKLSGAKTQNVSEHLSECDFCSAELYLLANFPPTEEKCTEAEMPKALRELAGALLGGKQKEFNLLNELLDTKEFLSFKNA